jgi:hypothetical protein
MAGPGATPADPPLLQLPPQLLLALAAACGPATLRQLRATCRELRAAANAATRGLGVWLHPDTDLAQALVSACASGLLALDVRSLRPGSSAGSRCAARGLPCACRGGAAAAARAAPPPLLPLIRRRPSSPAAQRQACGL